MKTVEVIQCFECKHARKSKENFDFDGTPLCDCLYMAQPNRWHEYCSWAQLKISAKEKKDD